MRLQLAPVLLSLGVRGEFGSLRVSKHRGEPNLAGVRGFQRVPIPRDPVLQRFKHQHRGLASIGVLAGSEDVSHAVRVVPSRRSRGVRRERLFHDGRREDILQAQLERRPGVVLALEARVHVVVRRLEPCVVILRGFGASLHLGELQLPPRDILGLVLDRLHPPLAPRDAAALRRGGRGGRGGAALARDPYPHVLVPPSPRPALRRVHVLAGVHVGEGAGGIEVVRPWRETLVAPAGVRRARAPGRRAGSGRGHSVNPADDLAGRCAAHAARWFPRRFPEPARASQWLRRLRDDDFPGIFATRVRNGEIANAGQMGNL